MPYAILFHLAFAVLIYGSDDIAPPSTSNFSQFFSNLTWSNSTNIENQATLRVDSFFFDMFSYYQSSLNRPVTQTFGFLTVLLFLILFVRLFIYLPFRRVTNAKCSKKNKTADSSIIKQLDKPIFVDDPEIRFVKMIETYHLKEKLRVMRRQRQISNLTPAYKERFKILYKMYMEEHQYRKGNPSVNKHMKGNPFYGYDYIDDYKKKFGLYYTQKLVKNPDVQLDQSKNTDDEYTA